jgi:arginine deiminase
MKKFEMNRFMMRNVLGYTFLIPFLYYLFTGKAFYAAGMCIIISGMFWLTRVGEEDIIDEKRSFLDQVRQKLHVEHVYVKMRKKPLKRSAFGGFAIPILPFFASIGYSEMIDKGEVMVHELVHDNVFIYGFQTALFYLLVAFINAASYFET